MSVMNDFSSAFSSIEKLKKHKITLTNAMSNLDRQINDFYHVMELVPLNASELSIITKKLRNSLKYRRELKEQSMTICNMLSSNVESIKSPELIESNAKNRLEKYTQEALLSYSKIFGKPKKVKSK